jgi:hypothetical protein
MNIGMGQQGVSSGVSMSIHEDEESMLAGFDCTLSQPLIF